MFGSSVCVCVRACVHVCGCGCVREAETGEREILTQVLKANLTLE